MHFLSAKSASLGVFDREFRGKEQQEKPRVREFRELWIASLRGLSVFWLCMAFSHICNKFFEQMVLPEICLCIFLLSKIAKERWRGDQISPKSFHCGF